jgi:hypothetical protein
MYSYTYARTQLQYDMRHLGLMIFYTIDELEMN